MHGRGVVYGQSRVLAVELLYLKIGYRGIWFCVDCHIHPFMFLGKAVQHSQVYIVIDKDDFFLCVLDKLLELGEGIIYLALEECLFYAWIQTYTLPRNPASEKLEH